MVSSNQEHVMSNGSSSCPSWASVLERLDGRGVAVLATLGAINVAVVIGNLLVIASVFISSKLRTVTNFFIVSLAVADFFLGFAVLPYSIILEVLEVWIFGQIWCQIWLAVDVWMCTSSILNLCAISVDRYLAITRPVHYRSLMSSRRAKMMIGAVWVLAFIICFPPLVGWNDGSQPPQPDNNRTTLFLNLDVVSSGEPFNLTDDTGLPLPQFFTAYDSQLDEALISLGPEDTENGPGDCQCALINNKGYVIYSALGSFYIPMFIMLFFYWRIYLAAIRTSRALERGFKTTKGSSGSSTSGPSEDERRMTLRIHRGNPEKCSNAHRHSGDLIVPRKGTVQHTNSATSQAAASAAAAAAATGLQRTGAKKYQHFRAYNGAQQSGSGSGAGGSNKLLPADAAVRISKRNIRWHARRFHSEAKATKTVGIIVGGFICCWLPFFTVYLTRAFCEECVPPLLFSVFFWLGYCNSALNPLIYGLVSKDFRRAFKRIVCRCFLKDEGVSSLIRQIHLPTFFVENNMQDAEDPGTTDST